MLAEQRREQILDALNEKGSISINELHRRLNVSRETIRRDITKLDMESKLRKTHGGALSFEAVEPDHKDRMELNLPGKKAIGYLAASLVPDSASVIIDSGTTTIWLAEALRNRHQLTVYTNDIQIANRLIGRNENRVFLMGGELQPNDGATYGRDSTTMLENYLADFSFVSASALLPEPRLMDYSREAAELRATMLSHGRVSVLLADQIKLSLTATFRVNNLDKLTHFITDSVLDSPIVKSFQDRDVEVLTAIGE